MQSFRLSVMDRIQIQGNLPQQGGKILMLLTHSILKKVDFSADEIDRFGMKDLPEGGISWKRDESVDIAFYPDEVQVIKDMLETLDKEEKITKELIPLILAFEDSKTR